MSIIFEIRVYFACARQENYFSRDYESFDTGALWPQNFNGYCRKPHRRAAHDTRDCRKSGNLAKICKQAGYRFAQRGLHKVAKGREWRLCACKARQRDFDSRCCRGYGGRNFDCGMCRQSRLLRALRRLPRAPRLENRKRQPAQRLGLDNPCGRYFGLSKQNLKHR